VHGTVAKAADHLHGTEKQLQVTGEFIVANQSTRTEREQSDHAWRVDEEIIREVVARKLRGRDIGKTWNDVRYRWQDQRPLKSEGS
jgi:hypothetical protein